MNGGNASMVMISDNGHNTHTLQEHHLEMDTNVKNELNTNEHEKDDNDNNYGETVHHQQDYYDQENRNNEQCKTVDPSAYGSRPLSSNHYLHEATPSIVHPMESGPTITPMIESGLIPQSACLTQEETPFCNHNTRNQREKLPRPTRESVLRRLSDALLRKSLTLVSSFEKINVLQKLSM